MTDDDFTDAATSAYEDYVRTPKMNVGTFRDRIAEAYMDAAEWARAYLTERCTACGEDPSGPLRPLTTDERSYRYAQDLGYELPEDPR